MTMQRLQSTSDRRGSSVLRVGQDRRGRWLVQDTVGHIEGFFTSRDSALGFARSECDLLHATIEMSEAPLTSRLQH